MSIGKLKFSYKRNLIVATTAFSGMISAMELYSYFRSSAAFRVRIALNLKGLEYQQVPVNLLNAEQLSEHYRQHNPQGLVPALALDDNTVLAQSMAIMEWLEEAYPQPALLPDTPLERAYVRGLCQHIACDVHPLNNMSVTNYLKAHLDADTTAVHNWYSHWMHRGFSAIEEQVSSGNGQVCYGQTPGLADCLLIPQMFNAFRFEVDMAAFPTLCAIYEYCNSLDAFIAANPAYQPDTPPA